MNKISLFAHRMVFILMTILLVFGVSFLSTDQVEIALYKFAMTSSAAVLGYWIDVILFSQFRPADYKDKLKEKNYDLGVSLIVASMQIRRAILIFGICVSVGLGL